MDFLLKFQKLIMFLSSVFIFLGLSLSVLLRYVLKIDLFGIEELLIIPTFCLYFFGAAYGTYEKSNITADILDSYIKNENVLLWIRTITNLASIAAAGIFSYWAFQYFIWSVNQMEKTSGWHIPLYIPHGIVMIGFILMTLFMFIHLYRQIQLIRGKKVEGM